MIHFYSAIAFSTMATNKQVARFTLGAALIWIGMGSSASAVDWTKRDKDFKDSIQPILKTACLDCHSGAEADGGLVLSNFQSAKGILKERRTWERVIQRLEIGDMPPKDATPLADASRKQLIDWIKSTMNDIDCGKNPNPGSVTLRRLNRAEYRNTIKDLFGIDYSASTGFPGDDVGYGFDNIGDVLTLPPLLMEKYIRAAEEISQQVIAPEPGPVYESARKPSELTASSGGSANANYFGFYSNGKITIEEQVPWQGTYLLEIGAAGSPAADIYPHLVVSLDGKKIKEFTVQTDGIDRGKTFSTTLRMRTKKQTIGLEFTNDLMVEGKNGKPTQDRNIRIFDVKLTGQKPSAPIPAAQLPESHRKLVTAIPSTNVTVKEAASKVLKPIAVKAFRRPLTADELSRLAALVDGVVESGETYEGGLQAGIQAILVSPNFLFKVEDPAEKVAQEFPLLTDFELATRLSYFLWSSMPDEELIKLAYKKQLRDPEVLRKQIRRMIEDKRSTSFVHNFAGQWLTLRRLEQFSPNQNLFPQWNDEIRELARRETYWFIAGVMREDMSVLRLLDADFTYLNEKLARFYGVAGIEGDQFRKVTLKGKPRMGLLTHASVLAVTSNPTRTSPVKRGKWILDNILGTPPPPAPPGVPELDKRELTGTLRQRIEQHRSNPACAACHKLMDPLGLALENYDAVGRWRTQDRGETIDASGTLPTGENVKNAGELVRVLRDHHSDKFVRCLTEKLMVYALGRGLEYYDRCAIDKIQSKLARDEFRFSSLIYEIVVSDPFQRKGVRDDL